MLVISLVAQALNEQKMETKSYMDRTDGSAQRSSRALLPSFRRDLIDFAAK